MGPLPPDIGIANSDCIDSRTVHSDPRRVSPLPGNSDPRPETGAVENPLDFA